MGILVPHGLVSWYHMGFVVAVLSTALVDGNVVSSPSGSQDGTVHLWIVQGKEPIDGSYEDAVPVDKSDSSSGVHHVNSFRDHAAPITTLVFCESAVLLASGCKAGAVRVWDLWVRRGGLRIVS